MKKLNILPKLKQTLQLVRKPIKWFRKLRKRNKILLIIAVLVIGFIVFKRIQSSNVQPQYVTNIVEKRSISQIVSETGNVATASRVDMFSATTGIVEKIYIENGDAVKIGQSLFSVRSTATDQEKAAAYAAYQSASSAYQQALNNRRNTQAAVDNVHDQLKDHSGDENFAEKSARTASEVANDNSYDTLKSAEASLKSAEAAYRSTQNLTIRAQSSGTIANLAYKVGDKVTAGSAGKSVLTIANFSDYTVKLALNEVDVPKVKKGESAKLNLDAFPGKTFDGKVASIDSIGTDTAGVITYNVIVEIVNPEESIRPSMTANVDIEVDKVENVLTVPNSAIKPYQGKKAVQIYDKKTKTIKYIPVEVGIKSPERTEIKSGVDEGTEVVISVKNGSLKSSANIAPSSN